MALSQFELIPVDQSTLMTDGKHILYNPKHVLESYRTGKEIPVRDYLHMVMHCVFRQIGEPVIDFTTIQKDRYRDIEIPAVLFQHQHKHGITLNNNLKLRLKGCYVSDVSGSVFGDFGLDFEGTLTIGSFAAKKSRAANHVIGMLDTWTVDGRILKDDVSIVTQLPEFTLAQITDFIKLASENNCINCTAALLEYKNATFAGYDPMDEFSLDL